MDLATSMPETGNLSLLNSEPKENNNFNKSTSMEISKVENENNDDDDEDEDEDVPIKPFGKLKSSLENVNNNIENSEEVDSIDDVQSEKDENEIKMEKEYEKVLKSYLPFHLQTYLENLEEEDADTMKTTYIETFCVIAAINIADIF
ncbi:hypothetical protein PIROE2DRAFT_7009 [Piromyces sp. E2]|nr:hypothetical protein PIROE2DRAFT_7009 [Piromyces sp. E2]|eukprot:OUM65934.1 hypothetical protein PIROE2DRAFT_7009 [Piromyces sp. E2]